MTKPETPSEYITIAVPTVVGGVLKLSTMPPIETGRAATLKDISVWPMAMTIIGSQDSWVSSASWVVALICRPAAVDGWSVLSSLGLRDEQIHSQLAATGTWPRAAP